MLEPMHFTFCPVCKQHFDSDGTQINEPASQDYAFEDHGYHFCNSCLSNAKDVMFDAEIPLSTALLDFITVPAYRNNPMAVEAAMYEEQKYNQSAGDLFEKLGEIMKPVSEEQFAGIIH